MSEQQQPQQQPQQQQPQQARRADARYRAKVVEVGLAKATQRDTCGIFFHFERTGAGPIDHTMYITQTAESLDIAEKSLAALGVPMKYLSDPGWWATVRAGKAMIGVECEIVCGDEEYKGVVREKVKFINSPRPEAPEGTELYFAKLFSRPGSAAPARPAQSSSAEPPEFPQYEPTDADAAQAAAGARRY